MSLAGLRIARGFESFKKVMKQKLLMIFCTTILLEGGSTHGPLRDLVNPTEAASHIAATSRAESFRPNTSKIKLNDQMDLSGRTEYSEPFSVQDVTAALTS